MARIALVMCGLALVASGCRGSGLGDRLGELRIVMSDGATVPDAEIPVGPTPMLATADVQVKLRNIGSGSVRIVSITPDEPTDVFSIKAELPITLESVETTSISVRFAPPQDSDVTKLNVEHRTVFRIQLEGTADALSVVTMTMVGNAVARDCYVPAQIDFGLVPIGENAQAAMTLKNDAPVDQHIDIGPIEGAQAAVFSMPTPRTTLDVQSKKSGSVTYAFVPPAAQSYDATVTVRRAGACPPGTVHLVGQGSDEAVTWSPPLLDFGRVPVGGRIERPLTLTNRGAGALALTNFVVTGAGFTITAPPSKIAANQMLPISVACQPGAVGKTQGELTFRIGSTMPKEVRVPLTCLAGGPRIAVSPSMAVSFGRVPYIPNPPYITTSKSVSVRNIGSPPTADDPDANLRFGRNGTFPLFSIEPAVGTRADEFQVTVPQSYVHADGIPAVAGKNRVDLDVRFTPAGTGSKEAKLRIFSNDVVQPEVVITLNGAAMADGQCKLQLDATSINFGDVPRGAQSARTLSVKNVGTVPCVLAGIEVAPGTDESFSYNGMTNLVIASGSTATLSITVKPNPSSADGLMSGFFRFSVNSSTDPFYLLPLGARVAPCLVLAPTTLDFGNVRVGCRTPSKSVDIFNACSLPITLKSLTLPAGVPFTIAQSPSLGTNGVSINSISVLHLSVAFVPTAEGVATAQLEALAQEGGAPVVTKLSLTGNGTPSQATTVTDSIVQSGTLPADILFVVDNSCSMSDKQQALAANFAAFFSDATQRGVQYQIGVTTTDDSVIGAQGRLQGTLSNPKILTNSTPNVAQLFASKVNVGVSGSGLEQPLSSLLKALTPPLIHTENAGFVRPDAVLAVVVVSDAPDQSVEPLSYYKSRLETVKDPRYQWLYSFNAIAPFSYPMGGCSIDSGLDDGRYNDLVGSSHGVKADICTKNWAQDLKSIADNALGARTHIYLTSSRDNTKPITVNVDGQPATGWTYDTMLNAVVFSATSLPPSGAAIDVTYTALCL